MITPPHSLFTPIPWLVYSFVTGNMKDKGTGRCKGKKELCLQYVAADASLSRVSKKNKGDDVADTKKIADVAAGTAVIGYNMEDLESLILTAEKAVGRSSFFEVPSILYPSQVGKIQIEEEAAFGRGKGQRKVGSYREAYAPKPMDTPEGAPKNLNLIEWDKLWNINKKIIDPVYPRHALIVKEGCVLLTLPNGPETLFVCKIPKFKRYQGAEIKKDTDGNVTDLKGVLHPKGSFKASELKLTRLPDINELAPLTLVEFGYLIKKTKVYLDFSVLL
ncbi:hypothetical protein Tco_1009703 [Tanacetum coccineum]